MSVKPIKKQQSALFDKWDIFLILIITIFGLVAFWKSFFFGLFGDDWHHYFFIMDCRALNYSCWRFIFHPYGGETLFMNIMEEFFKYESLPYYVISFIFRAFFMTGFYLLIKYLTKIKAFAFTAALFLMVSLGGIETTDWVHYANVYFAATFLMLGYVFYFRYLNEGGSFYNKWLPLYYLMFFVAIIITPVRTHGILFLYPLTELFIILLNKEKYKESFKRIAIFLLMIVFIRKLGFFGSQEEQSTFVQGTINFITTSWSNFLQALFTPLGTFSNMILPRNILGSFLNHKIYYSIITKKIFLLFMIPSLLLNAFLYISSKKKSLLYAIPPLGWGLYLLALRYIYPAGLEVPGREMLVGGRVFFMVISLLNYLLINNYKDNAFKLMFLLVWPFAFVFVPHLFNPNSVMTAEARYLNIPTAGAIALYVYSFFVFVTIVLSDLAQNLKKENRKYLDFIGYGLFAAMSAYLIFYNFTLVRYYFESSYYRRNAQTVNTVFRKSVDIIDKYDLKDFSFIIFDYDESDYFHDAVYFGGGFRYAVEKGIVETAKFPQFIGRGDIESEIASPGFIKNKYGRDLSENKNIIGIRILKTGEVTDITKEIRTKVEKTVNK